MNDCIYKIINFESDKKSNYITLQFESGMITRRKCYVKKTPVDCTDHLTGGTIPANQDHYFVAIKRQGYGTYRLKISSVQTRLSREDVCESDDPLEQNLVEFLNECKSKRSLLDQEEANLREGLREVKFKRSSIGKKVSVASNLLELITKGD